MMPEASNAAEIIGAFQRAVDTGCFDAAARLLDDLERVAPQATARPVYRTMLALRQGHHREALYALGEDHAELRVMCLRIIGDPTWEGLARSLADDSPDPTVRQAMRVMLRLPTEVDE